LKKNEIHYYFERYLTEEGMHHNILKNLLTAETILLNGKPWIYI